MATYNSFDRLLPTPRGAIQALTEATIAWWGTMTNNYRFADDKKVPFNLLLTPSRFLATAPTRLEASSGSPRSSSWRTIHRRPRSSWSTSFPSASKGSNLGSCKPHVFPLYPLAIVLTSHFAGPPRTSSIKERWKSLSPCSMILRIHELRLPMVP